MSSFLASVRAPLDRYFGITAAGSTFSTEIRAGVTTFLTMAYILFINPQILSQAIKIDGLDLTGQLMAATALAAAVGSFMMGVYARYPFALAPGMGLNAYFAFSVVLGHGVPWQTALGAVFISGLIFLALSFAGVREMIMKAIPLSIKRATAVGIGCFLALVGVNNSGLVVSHPVTLLTLGDVSSPGAVICLIGLLLTGVLLALKVRGALLIGVAGATAIAMLSGAAVYNGQAFAGFPNGFVGAPAWPTDLFLAMNVSDALGIGLIGIVFTFTFVDLFDTAGTLIGLSDKAGFLDRDGNLPRASRAFATDAMATSFGALVGTSSTTAYVESAAGIEDGGRTGFTACVAAMLFLLSLFFWPLAGAVPAAATAPALIIVGAMMMEAAARIEWHDCRVSIPAFLTIIGTPFTYSIATGVSLGIISYTLIHLCSGRARQVHWLMYVLSLILIAKFAWGTGH